MTEPHATQHNRYLSNYLTTGETKIINNSREVEGIRKNKELFPMLLSVTELPPGQDNKRCFIGSIQDLTLSKQKDEQLQRSQKMDALGKLTGGVAHDFNNILGIILGYSDLIKSQVEDQLKLIKYVSQINHAAIRGKKLTSRLLSFSKQKNSNSEVLTINKILLDSKNMLEKTLTARIQIKLSLTDDPWLVFLDSGDLEDAILNMSINAMHSIEGTGQLTFKTDNEQLNQTDADTLQLNTGDYVVLRVIDTGCGMNQDIKEKIFEPFFTSKGDKGTGLGLSQVYGFVTRNKGAIHVYSEPGHGTLMALYFPRDYQKDDMSHTKAEKDHITELKGNEKILVVDDEPALVELTVTILTSQGYQVIRASNAKQALNILDREPVDVMLSDIIMPEINGYELASIVQKKFPSIKIQLTSGFTGEQHSDIENNELNKNILNKPYNSIVLLQRIRELLDSPI